MRSVGFMCYRSKLLKFQSGDVAQLVRALPCHGRGRGFEPRRPRHKSKESMVYGFLSDNSKIAMGRNGTEILHRHFPASNSSACLPLAVRLSAETAWV